MRKSLQKFFSPYSLRAAVAKNMPVACCFVVPLIALSVLQQEWGNAAHHFCLLIVLVAAQTFARNERLWDRYMGWLPDELKGKK